LLEGEELLGLSRTDIQERAIVVGNELCDMQVAARYGCPGLFAQYGNAHYRTHGMCDFALPTNCHPIFHFGAVLDYFE
jgi:phosphoglycolate phosphatase-like HAD superfamily hydrolase